MSPKIAVPPGIVIAVAGLPTSGKTTLGRALAEATGVHFVDIDDTLARCAPPQESNPYATEEGRAREQVRMRVLYTLLHAVVEANLDAGFSLVIAATYSRPVSRKFLLEATERGGGQARFVLCTYHDTPEEIERRVDGRLARGGVGGCRSVQHYSDDRARYNPFDPLKHPHLVVRMEGDDKGTRIAVEQAITYINGE